MGAALLGRKRCVLLQGRDAELLEETQHGLCWTAVMVGCFYVARGHVRVNDTCSSREHPLDSSCQSTNLSVRYLYEQ